jgi:hypothetical protein
MFGIGHLLKKVQNRQTREYFVRDIVRGVLKEVINSDVLVENIKLKESAIQLLNLTQGAKSEVYMKKQQILKLVNERQDIVKVVDLR